MRLICPNCDATYEVPDSVIPPEGRDVQCSNCGTTWFFDPNPQVEAETLPPEPEVEAEPEPELPPEEVTDLEVEEFDLGLRRQGFSLNLRVGVKKPRRAAIR
ncbi:MAG: zinc-ribbon domain-containing protein, partial [Pseudomonadota bacterium]